jgi:hypothetical protein
MLMAAVRSINASLLIAFVALATLGLSSSAVAAVTASLQTQDGHYVTAVDGGPTGSQQNCGSRMFALHANAMSAGPRARFVVVWLGNNKIALMTPNGANYVTAVNGGNMGTISDGQAIHTNATAKGVDEIFTLLFSADYRTVALRTAHGHYVTAAGGGGCGGSNSVPIHTDATSVGPWENFTLNIESGAVPKHLLALLQSSTPLPGTVSKTPQTVSSTPGTISRPTLPPLRAIGDCGMDDNHNTASGQPAQVDYVEVYSSKYTKWCVDAKFWPSNSHSIRQFFAYYDYLVPQMSSLFNINLPLPLVIEATWPDGSACACGPKFGGQVRVALTGDAFSNTFTNPQNNQSIPGFWGYLLPMHETVNTLTGQIGGGGWPTDWWADHRSPFPNAMDEQIMRYIGTNQNNQTVLNAASAQHERFADPKQSGFDSEIAMFDNFFSRFGGFPTFARFFSLVRNDGIQWVPVAQDPTYTPDNNTSPLLSEYVIAYLSLAFGTTSDLTQKFINAGVGKLDKTITPYKVSTAAVKGIANAHCSIRAAAAAGVSVSASLAALQKGNYKNAIATGGTSSSCPSECSWATTSRRCVAKW